MGEFVLGMLVAWLLEWIFFTFWVKRGTEQDCLSLQSELDLKNKQIRSLQSQLSSISESSSKNTSKTNPQSSDSSKPLSKSSTTKAKTTVAKRTISKTKKTTSKSQPKTSTSAKKSKSKTQTRKANAKGDDFTKISGIGPSMSATLKTLGIDTFKKLAATDDDVLRDLLEKSGARMNNNKDVMDSWNEQATLAAKGDFETLKRMQITLKK